MFGFLKGSHKEPQDDLDQANEMATANLSIANNALRIAQETEEIGASTIEELVVQEEKIDRINDALAEIEINADESNKKLHGIRSVPGAILNGFKKHCCCCLSTPEEQLDTERKKNRKAGKKKKKHRHADKDNSSDTLHLPSWNRPNRSLDEREEQFTQTTSEIDHVVAQIDSAADRLQVQADRMGEQLDRRNDKLDLTNERVDSGTKKLKKNHQKMKI